MSKKNINKTMVQFFEWYIPDDTMHWKRCSVRAAGLANMGVTAVWLPPAYKGSDGVHDIGYGVYDMYDLGEFDQKGSVPTKYGTRRQYLDAVEDLHANGLEVLADIVLDHRLGADEQEKVVAVMDRKDNRWEQESGPREITAWTKFTFPGRGGRYSDFTWSWRDFKGTDWDGEEQYDGVFRFIGKDWAKHTDREKGTYDFLMGADVDLDNPRVVDELKKWGKWYLDTVHMDGFRIDAVKHMKFTFFYNWLSYLRYDSGKELFAVGEYWNSELERLQHYLKVCGKCMSLFDVPLHFRMQAISQAGGGFDMGNLFSDTLVQEDPEHAVTFVDNHDTQPGQSLMSWVEAWFRPLAYALILLRKDGYPCVFYGDLYGIPHDKIQPVGQLPLLIKARSLYAYGEQHDYFDHFDVVGWTREGDEEHPDSGMAVVITDGPGGEKEMYVNENLAGQSLYDCMGNYSEPVVIEEDGTGTFPVPGGAVSVWVTGKAYEYLTVEFIPFR